MTVLAGCLASTVAFAELEIHDPVLSEARWISADSDVAYVLTHSPAECLSPSGGNGIDYQRVLGRAAFNSPFLLGGQAARNHLSCNSCHLNGHDNAQFFLAGLSGTPGSADVTSSIFSKVREDGVFNPVRIPTLVGAKGKEEFGSVAPVPTIHAFVEGAVKDEFQGEASASIIAAVSEYVAQLEPQYCQESDVPIDLAKAISAIDEIIGAARVASEKAANKELDFLILSAQHQLGRIHERYAGETLTSDRAVIVEFSQYIGAFRPDAAQAGVISNQDVADLRDKLKVLAGELAQREHLSLYSEAVLRGRLGDTISDSASSRGGGRRAIIP